MGKTLTQEEYEQRLYEVNPHLKVCEEYKGMYIPIQHYCKTHDIYFIKKPINVLHSVGCNECTKDKKHKVYAKTKEEYESDLRHKNPNVILIGEYTNCKTSTLHKCLVCGSEFMVRPSNLLSGKGCPYCANKKRREGNLMPLEEYKQRLSEISPDIIIIGDYINARTKTLHKCLKHNIEYMVTPAQALRGTGCIECQKERYVSPFKRTNDEYIRILKEVNPTVVPVGEYADRKTRILHKCLIHNYIWETSPASVLNGCGCPLCRSDKIRSKAFKTHDQYVKDAFAVNPDIEVVEKYIDVYTPILHKCLIDGYEFKAAPIRVLSGTGCPVCNESKGEREIRQWLENKEIKYIYQMKYDDCKDIHQLPFDFYLPEYNTACEYQGQQHYYPVDFFGGEDKYMLQQKHDNIKREYCKENGIRLLEIPYYANIEETLNNFLFT